MADKIENIPGVGEKIAEKLREAGYTEFMGIAASSAGEIEELWKSTGRMRLASDDALPQM